MISAIGCGAVGFKAQMTDKKIGTAHISNYCCLSECTIKKFLGSKVGQPNRKTLALIKHCLKIPTRKRISIVSERHPDGFLRLVGCLGL